MTQLSSATSGPGPALQPAAVIVGDAAVRLWGLTSRQRIQKQLARLGIPVQHDTKADSRRAADVVLVLHAGWVFDEPLLSALAEAAVGTLLLDEVSGAAVAAKVSGSQAAAVTQALTYGELPEALTRRTPATLAGQYNNKLRKREIPYLLPLTAATLPAIEKRMFAGSYKGVTDLVTKYVWPLPSRHVTKLCAISGVTPNMVTTISLLMVIIAFHQFWNGHFGLGLIAAWMMTFLDTVDGKLARVTLNSSKFGDIFDHGIDLIHPPFWWWAWVVGLDAVGLPLEHLSLILSVVLGGYVAQRVEEGLFMKLFGIEMHIWRPIDSFFRLITARRNPNLLLLSAATLAGRPDLGMIAVAIWTLICFCLHALQIVQAALAQRRAPIVSWLSR